MSLLHLDGLIAFSVMCVVCSVFFFFSSRRRHTRWPRDWSSDVCSSDLRRAIRRALISVYDKTGLDDLARGLHAAGVELVSTGSTAARIQDAGVPVTPVEAVTGLDRKSTRLNSSHVAISYAVFCLKKKTRKIK